MKYFVIFLVLIGFLFSTTNAQYSDKAESYHLPVNTESGSYSIMAQSIITKFTKTLYDEPAKALIFSISSDEQLIDTMTITMNRQTFLKLFPNIESKDPKDIFLLVNGEEIPYEAVVDLDTISWVFMVPPKSTEIELIGLPFWDSQHSVKPKLLIDMSNFIQIYSPLKQTHLDIFENIQCKENLILLQKYDGSPACVTEQTKTKLIERGWASTNGIRDTVGSSNGHWKLKTEVFVATSLKELTPIDTVKIGGQYSATAILTKPLGMSDQHSDLGYVMYVQVLDLNGDWIAGSWHHGIIKTNQTTSAGTYWSPKDAGNYTIEVFAWQSFTGTPHADVSRHTVEVTE